MLLEQDTLETFATFQNDITLSWTQARSPTTLGESGVSQHTVDSTTNLAKRLKCNGVFKNFMVSCYTLNVPTIKIPENKNTYIITFGNLL